MEDVARRAGVSVSTASRALSGRARVSPAVQERVRAAALELSYVPSSSAYTLATGRNRNIGVVVPYVDRWYFSTVLASIDEYLNAAGFDLTLYNLNGHNPDQRQRIFDDFLLRRRVDALLSVAIKLTASELSVLHALERPVVAIGGPVDGIPTVGIDDFGAGKLAANHLLSLGHTRIGFVGVEVEDQGDFSHPALRRAGYEEALRDAGLEAPPEWTSAGELSMPGGYRAAKRLLADPRVGVTAIVATSDEMAFGAMRAAHEIGMEIPRDLSLVGIDGHSLAGFHGLTTISQDTAGQARRAAELVVESVQNPQPIDEREEWPLDLVPGSSTARYVAS